MAQTGIYKFNINNAMNEKLIVPFLHIQICFTAKHDKKNHVLK